MMPSLLLPFCLISYPIAYHSLELRLGVAALRCFAGGPQQCKGYFESSGSNNDAQAPAMKREQTARRLQQSDYASYDSRSSINNFLANSSYISSNCTVGGTVLASGQQSWARHGCDSVAYTSLLQRSHAMPDYDASIAGMACSAMGTCDQHSDNTRQHSMARCTTYSTRHGTRCATHDT